MEHAVVENDHEAKGNGLFVRKRSGTASPPSTVTRTRSSMSTMASSFSTIRSLSFRDSPSTPFKYGPLLESSDTDALENFDTVDDALDAVAAERLRYMPHDGSLLDRIFRWSTHVFSHINELSKAVEPFVPDAVDAARMSWGHCLMLLQIGPDHSSILVKAFQTFQEITLELARCINQSVLINSIPGVQGEIAGAYMDLIELISSVAVSYYRGSRGSLVIEAAEFESRFGHHIESFYTRKAMLTELMWSTTSILQGASLKKTKEFLSFQDSAIPAIIASRRPAYAEFTCDWFAAHLSQIKHRKNGLSVITGGPGSGKTVLSQWVIDHSQISNEDEFDVIVYRVYEDISATTSSIAVAKGLLLQMLDRQIGNQQLLQAIDKAIQLSSSNVSALEVEEALWGALRIAVQGADRLVIVVDGISSLHGDPDAGPRVLQQLNSLTSQTSQVKVIALSRPLKTSLPQRTFQFSLEPSHIAKDIQTVVLDTLSATKPFRDLQNRDRESIAEAIISKSSGTFLWPELVIHLAGQQRTINDILSAVQVAPTTVNEVLEQVVAKFNLDDSEVRSISAWSLAAQRPLLVHEIKALLETGTKEVEHVHRVGAVQDDILRAIGPLVTIKDSAVFFKHPVYRHYLLSVAGAVADFSNTGKFPFHLKEAHYDLAIRCLAHVKHHVRDEVDVSMTPLSLPLQTRFFSRYHLLEYTARYWISHFMASPMAGDNECKLTSTFKQSIPDGILLALLEGSCLPFQYTLQHAEQLQMTAFRVRKSVFGASNPSVLQALIFEAILSHRLQLNARLDFAYEVWSLSKVVLGFNNPVVKASAELFIQVLGTVTEVSETTLSRKEELLLYLIDIAREDRGSSHEITIKYSQMLVQLYIDIKQTEKATRLCKELYDISVSQYGQFSSETAEISTLLFEQLNYLSESETAREIIETGHEYTMQTLDIMDGQRITSTLSVVDIYERRGDITKAESVFFELWQGISRSEEISKDVVEKQIKVALAYSEFLVRHSSRDEAENIVSTLWESIERRQQLDIEHVVSWSQSITAHMKNMQWHSLAHSTLTSVWERCQTLEQSSYSETIAESLIDSVQETTEETTEIETETTTVVARRKKISIAREAFESVMSSKTTSKDISIATLKTAETLVTSYAEEKKWEESMRVSQRLLDRQWKGIETSKQVITLAQGVKQTVTVALNLAVSYFETLQVEKASNIYRNVFHSLLLSVSVEDDLVTQTLRAAIEFYEKTYQFSRAIVLYQDYVAAIKSAHVEDHHLLIEISYALADLAIRCHQPGEAEKAYLHIFTVFNHDGDLHQDGIKAAHGLCKLYMEQQRWEEALLIYPVLWDAITKYAGELQLETDYIQETYRSYTYLLETNLHAKDTVIRDLAYNYRETCIALYGHEHIMTYKATVQLAEVSQRIEQYHEESIAMYESALRYSEEFSEEILTYETTTTREEKSKKKTTIKEHLAEMYSRSEKTVTKATELYTEEFNATSSQYGYASQETLTSLEQLVLSYKKQSSVTEAVESLQTVVTNVFESETDTQKLTESARRLATLYLEIGQQESAISLFQELRRRLVYDAKSISRKATVFVVAFEEVISGGSYTTIMADLVAEMHLYDAFFNVAKTAKFIDAFTTGVRLLIFQRSKSQEAEAQRTDVELYRLFTENYSVSDGQELRAFYELCIEEVLRGDYEVRIASRTVSSAHQYFQEENFQAAYNVALLFHEFVHSVDGFRSQAIVKQGFKLCKYLQGHGMKRTPDAKLQAVMLGLSKSILTHILRVYRSLGIRFTELDVLESNELAVLLGEQRNFEDLEILLTDLWTSRIVQKTWSSDTIVAIGRRLVEARFSCGKTQQALRLCSDICYNLRRVWGAFDRVALELTALLSELYTSTNNYRAAMAVHEKVLRQLISESESPSLAEGAVIATKQVEFLKRSYQRLGGWDKEAHLYKQLFKALDERFGGETAWQSTASEQLDQWPKGDADELGMWHAPGSYGFLSEVTGEGPEKRPAHQNQLRKVSETRVLTIRGSA